MRTVAAVLALVACVHAGLWASLRTKESAPDFTGQLASVSYAPPTDPNSSEIPTAEEIRADLKAIAPYTKAIRTYSATGGAELVPPIAAEFGLKVTVGAAILKDQDSEGKPIKSAVDRNEREIRSAVELARKNSNVKAIVVGNEAVLTKQITADGLIAYIRKIHPDQASRVDDDELSAAIRRQTPRARRYGPRDSRARRTTVTARATS